MKLEAERVREIFMSCLFKDGEDRTGIVQADGIICNVGFHPGRLDSYKDEIRQLLAELPDSFQASGGGGMSFLEACNDKHENQWGEHQAMEMLFQLGIGIGDAKCQMPRAIWSVLPGGMPYYVVGLLNKQEQDKEANG